MERLLHVAPAAALLERRLAERLASGAVTVELLRAHEEQAWAAGVAGLTPSLEPDLASVLRQALVAVPPAQGVSPAAVSAWAVALGQGGVRTEALGRGAPPQLIDERLADLAGWLGSGGVGEVRALARAALAFTRVLDIAPLPAGNDLVAHLALALMLRGQGLRLPLFEPGDASTLEAGLGAAQAFDFQPLTAALGIACARMLAAQVRFAANMAT